MIAYSEEGLIDIVDFFDNAPIGLHIVDPGGIILRANKVELEVMGYADSPQEYIGHHIAEFHAEQPVIDDMLNRLVSGQPLKHYQAKLRRRDGSTLPVIIHSTPRMEGDSFVNTRCVTYPDPDQMAPQPVDGQARQLSAMPDLNELSEAEKQALFEEFNDFFENGPVALHIVDPEGIIRRANRAELMGMGYGDTPEEYLGHHIAEFHVEQPVIDDMLNRLVSGRRLIHYKAKLRRKDGSTYPVFIYSSPRMDDGSFVNTRCFTFPLATGTYDQAPRYSWPRNEEVAAARSDGETTQDPRTVALRLMVSRNRAEETLGFLSEVGKTLASAEDPRRALNQAMGLIVPHFADWCAIDEVNEALDSLERIALGHIKPLNDVSLRLESFLYPADQRLPYSVAQVRQTGQAAYCFDVAAEAENQGEAERLRRLQAMGIKSLLVLPMLARGRLTGVISFAAANLAHRRAFGPADLAVAEELARWAGVAVELGQLRAQADRQLVMSYEQ